MLTEAKARQIIDTALTHAQGKCSGCEVTLESSDIATSRFANNSMTQNQAPERTSIAVRVLKNGRQARLTSDDLAPKSITRLLDEALAASQILAKDPGLLPLLSGHKKTAAQPNRLDRKTASLSAEARADAVAEIIKIASSRGLSAAGVVASGSEYTAIGNSKGLFVSHRQSHAQCSVTMRAGDATGWSKAHHIRFADLDCAGLAERAADKAAANVNPVEIKPGRYTVILEPSAVLDLLAYIFADFGATSQIDKLSCFQDKLGKKVLGSNINIVDDVHHPFQAGIPFDGEGLPRQSVSLVKNGVFTDMVYGRRAAAKLKRKSTGHGLAEPNSSGEMPMNLIVGGGDVSLEEMIASSKKAILLTRVWYVRNVDPLSKIVTGMTRDGTFLVEDGAVKSAVKNLRFNQSLIEMLNSVVALGPSLRTAGEEGFPAVVPPMKVENFNFASTTTF
ncbi:MAG: TldD/PmbA family protein [Candidatus Obscuribacterales bacterium]|nr:TldD/PmbA family protein [Candidatus Obscuribacterales bacterium]